MTSLPISPGGDAGRFAGLVKAFWLRTRSVSIKVFTVPASFTKGVVAKTMSFIPTALGTMVAAGALSTRWGYNLAASTLSGAGRLLRWTIRKSAMVVNAVIDWTGHRIADVVGIVHQPSKERVNNGVEAFSKSRDIAVASAVTLGEHVGHAVMNGVRHPLVRSSVGIASVGVAALIGLKLVIPTAFGGLLALLPFAAGALTAVASGGAVPLAIIGGVAGVTTLLAMIGTALYRRTEAGKEGKTFRQAYAESKEQVALDEELLTWVKGSKTRMAKFEKDRATAAAAEPKPDVVSDEPAADGADEPEPVDTDGRPLTPEEIKRLADEVAKSGSDVNTNPQRRRPNK